MEDYLYALRIGGWDRAADVIVGMRKERDDVDQILGKALGYALAYPHVSAHDDGRVCTGEHTLCSLAEEAASRIAELTRAVDRHVVGPASTSLSGDFGSSIPFEEWHRLADLCRRTPDV